MCRSPFSILFSLVVGLLALHPALIWAQPTTAIVTGTERVFVRRGPGNEFAPFASIPSGSTVDVQEMSGEWAKIVTASGQVGYINSNFLALPGEQERRITPVRPTATHVLVATRTTTIRATSTIRPTPTMRPTTTMRPTNRRTPARARPEATATPTAAWATATPTAGNDLAAVRTLNDRNKTLEGEVLALRQEVAELKRHADAVTPTGRAGILLNANEAKTEVAHLTAAVEALQRRFENGQRTDDPSPLTAAPSDTGSHVISPIAVFLGMVGTVIGWMLGSSYARKHDRSRRSRLRF